VCSSDLFVSRKDRGASAGVASNFVADFAGVAPLHHETDGG
jgi:hypothetical protein